MVAVEMERGGGVGEIGKIGGTCWMWGEGRTKIRVTHKFWLAGDTIIYGGDTRRPGWALGRER